MFMKVTQPDEGGDVLDFTQGREKAFERKSNEEWQKVKISPDVLRSNASFEEGMTISGELSEVLKSLNEVMDDHSRIFFHEQRALILRLRTNRQVCEIIAEAMMETLRKWEKACCDPPNHDTEIVRLKAKRKRKGL